MSKIRIYCFGERYFLVRGEEYLSDILYGKLGDDPDLEILDTDDYNKILAEWEGFSPNSTPWMIHPNIGNEYREMLNAKALEASGVKTLDAPAPTTPSRYRVRRNDLPKRRQ